ncbi:dihydrofolate reductase [Rhodococcus sp. HNM0563]|uniref:dihydrofolate reductase family protein n=1 Tax=unclassified Rhodococcus (in: high G+C Gram-positive bacteria) TaxID=192944 RepID=UPI00146D2ACC|nr:MULTISPECIES: dihydrofolate reductase [unclassified Rhodococcus (in: high G+C Gram-positive bacteria)]MCK0090692.1 dihydrofolate reductase [Rhodococcus sp. F64268]NLU61886.1 dihydrofolate reductase [Rhodococcus sp. HNM0563]
MRRLVYYAAVTLDGYIAGPEGEFDFYPVADDMSWINERYPESVPTPLRELVDMPADTPNLQWDTVVMGRHTYEAGGMTSPYDHMMQYVVSRTLEPVDNPQVKIVDTDPVELVRTLKEQEGLDIWLCGGGNLAGQLIHEIDRLMFKSYPVIAGGGLPALSGNFSPTRFTVTARREFSNGMQLTWLDRA